jgi:hypothetical protein
MREALSEQPNCLRFGYAGILVHFKALGFGSFSNKRRKRTISTYFDGGDASEILQNGYYVASTSTCGLAKTSRNKGGDTIIWVCGLWATEKLVGYWGKLENFVG